MAFLMVISLFYRTKIINKECNLVAFASFFKGMQQILKQKIRLLNKRDENLEVIVSRRLRRFIGFVYIKISAYQFNPIYQRSLRHRQQPSS